MLRFEQPVKIGRMQNQLLTIGLAQPHRLFHHRTSTSPSAPLSSLFHHPFAIPEIKKITNSENDSRAGSGQRNVTAPLSNYLPPARSNARTASQPEHTGSLSMRSAYIAKRFVQ